MGWTKKTPTGRWKGCYRDQAGREHSKTFDRKRDAERHWQAAEASLLKQAWIDPQSGRVTVAEWSKQCMATMVHLKPKTVAGYRSLLKNLIAPNLGDVQLGRVDSILIKKWIADLMASGLSPSRVRQAHGLLSQFMDEAVEAQVIARNPCTRIMLPKMIKREMGYLTADQVARLASEVDDRYRTLVLVLAYCGLRWGEASALRRRKVDLLHRRIEVSESLAEVDGVIHFGTTKTHKVRHVTLPSFLVEQLSEHLDQFTDASPDALVFTSTEGAPLRNGNFRARVWRPALRRAALPDSVRIHDLRHTCATLLIAQGAPLLMVSRHLGHTSIQITQDTYGHLLPSEYDRIALSLDATYEGSVLANADVTTLRPVGL